MLSQLSHPRGILAAVSIRQAQIVLQCRFAGTKRKTKPNTGAKVHVVLTKEVEGLGFPGRVVSVSGGHFRNYLYPQNLAKYATPDDIAQAQKTEQTYKAETAGKSAHERLVSNIVRRMTKEPLRFQRLGSEFEITVEHIVRAMERQWRLRLNPASVVMEENPRALGNYSINVMVDEKTSVTVQLHVSKEPMDPKSLDLLARKQRAAAAAATQL